MMENDGILRLIISESRVLPNAKRIGSHIKCIGECKVTLEPDSKKCESVAIVLNNMYDTYSGFFLDSSHDASVVDEVNLVIHTLSISRISGELLNTSRSLAPKRLHTPGMLTLPFPPIDISCLGLGKVSVNIRPKYSHRAIEMTRNIVSRVLKPFLIRNVIGIICSYVTSIDVNIALWARCITEEADKVSEKRMNLFRRPMIQYQEHVIRIEPHSSRLTLSSEFVFLVHKLTMVFSKCDDENATPLDVMKAGSLSLLGKTGYEWTGRSAHIFDKISNNAEVPDEPIYTLTFDTQPYNKGLSAPVSRVNFSRNEHITFTFTLNPQPFAMTLRFTAENINELLIDGERSCVRFMT